MKKRCVIATLVLFIVIILSSYCLAAEIKPTASSVIKFTANQVVPEPVEPGKDVTIKVTIDNWDQVEATDVKVIPRVVFPFQISSQVEEWWRGFTLCIACSRENTYYFLIDSKAASGTYPLVFEITKGSMKMMRTVNVKVEGIPDVILLTESNEPILVEPKVQFKTDFIIRNIGTGEARNLKVISDSDSFISSGSNTQFVESLKPGKTANITAYFTASDELVPDVYNVPVNIDYKDAVGNAYSYQGDIGIIVRNKAEISVKNVKVRPSFIRTGDKYELSLRVENTGSGSAKNTIAKITTSAGDSVTQYIGQLKKDEDSSIVTSLIAKNDQFTQSTINKIEVELDYEDDLGSHMIKEQLLIEVMPATKYLWYLVYMGIALVAVLLFVFYYLYQHKKEQMENRFEEVIEYGLAEEFIKKHEGDWTKEHFEEFLRDLKKKNFNVDSKRLMRYLEKVRIEHTSKKS